MRYLTFIRSSESYRKSMPPPELMEAMGKFVEKSFKEGIKYRRNGGPVGGRGREQSGR